MFNMFLRQHCPLGFLWMLCTFNKELTDLRSEVHIWFLHAARLQGISQWKVIHDNFRFVIDNQECCQFKPVHMNNIWTPLHRSLASSSCQDPLYKTRNQSLAVLLPCGPYLPFPNSATHTVRVRWRPATRPSISGLNSFPDIVTSSPQHLRSDMHRWYPPHSPKMKHLFLDQSRGLVHPIRGVRHHICACGPSTKTSLCKSYALASTAQNVPTKQRLVPRGFYLWLPIQQPWPGWTLWYPSMGPKRRSYPSNWLGASIL